MRFLTLFLLAVVAAIPAQAVEVHITADPPTAYVNGDPLPAHHITGYGLIASRGIEGEITTTELPFTVDLAPGSILLMMRVYTTNGEGSMYAFGAADIQSNAPPNPPAFTCQ